MANLVLGVDVPAVDGKVELAIGDIDDAAHDQAGRDAPSLRGQQHLHVVSHTHCEAVTTFGATNEKIIMIYRTSVQVRGNRCTL